MTIVHLSSRHRSENRQELTQMLCNVRWSIIEFVRKLGRRKQHTCSVFRTRTSLIISSSMPPRCAARWECRSRYIWRRGDYERPFLRRSHTVLLRDTSEIRNFRRIGKTYVEVVSNDVFFSSNSTGTLSIFLAGTTAFTLAENTLYNIGGLHSSL